MKKPYNLKYLICFKRPRINMISIPPGIGLCITMVVLFLNSACVSASFGMASSHIPLAKKEWELIGPVAGQKTNWMIDFGFLALPLMEPPMIALQEELILQKDADALIRLRWSYDKMTFLMFVARQRLILKADAIRFKKKK